MKRIFRGGNVIVISPILQPICTDPGDEKLRGLAQEALLATGAAGIAIALETGDSIVCRARAGGKAPDLGARLDRQSGITGECVSRGATICCDDVQFDSRVNGEACRRLGIRSIMAVPLQHEHRTIGVLEAFSEKPGAFTISHRFALESVAKTIVSVTRGQTPQPQREQEWRPSNAPVINVVFSRAAQTKSFATPAVITEGCGTVLDRSGKLRVGAAAVVALLFLSLAAVVMLYTARSNSRAAMAAPAIAVTRAVPASSAAENSPPPSAEEVLVDASGDSGAVAESEAAELRQADSSSMSTLRSSAEAGDSNAEYRLATAFARGQGVRRDLVQAYAWYIAAHISGDSRSQEALRLLTKKMTAGQIAQVRVTIAEMFATGRGVRQDKVAAYSWLLLAQAAGGNAQAEATNLEANLNEQEIAEARTRAQSWLDAHRKPHSKVR